MIDGERLLILTPIVIREAKKIYVRLPGNKSYADIHATDPQRTGSHRAHRQVNQATSTVKFGDGSAVKKGSSSWLANLTPAVFGTGSERSWGIVSNLRSSPNGRRRCAVAPDNSLPTFTSSDFIRTDARSWKVPAAGRYNMSGEVGSLISARRLERPGNGGLRFRLPRRPGTSSLREGKEVEHGFWDRSGSG